jgi:hypothetical protein
MKVLVSYKGRELSLPEAALKGHLEHVPDARQRVRGWLFPLRV